jgi:outer membrane protein assembly factor BamB
VYIASQDRTLYAFDTVTGTSKWTFSDGNLYPSAAPIVANGTVYLGGDYIIFAVDVQTGAEKWSAPVDSPVQASPVAFNGTVYVASLGATLYAFDATTGNQIWNTSVGSGILIESPPAVANNLVYVIASDGKLRAFRARDGTLYWTSPVTDFAPTSSPAIANGIVYCANFGYLALYAVDGQTGATIWSSRLGNSPSASPAVANGVAYIGANDGKIYAFDAANGVPLWSGIVNAATTTGSPAVSDGTIYVGSSLSYPYDTYLTAFALNAGNDAAYAHRHTAPPSFATLHPDYGLKVAR